MVERIKLENMDQIREHITPFLTSKLEEFWMLGMERLTLDELWVFILEMMKKKKLTDCPLHELVNFIMRISVNDYLNKIRLEMFKGQDLRVFRERS